MTESEITQLQHRLRRALIIGGATVCVIAITGIGLRLHAQAQVKQWTNVQAIPTVDIVSPQPVAKMEELVLPGTLSAYFDAPIYARVDGYLKRWYVDIGAHVHAGQVLADIETPELDQQIHQVEADLVTAKANNQLDKITAERWNKMLASQSVSQQEADEKAAAYSVSQALVDSAQANLERLRALAAFKHVNAPFDGIVTARNTDVGNLINAGAGGKGNELFRVADEHEARVYVDVPQTNAGQIKVGLTAQLQLPENPGVMVPAKVADLSDAVSVASRTMQVELMADNPDHLLLPGEYVEVHFQIPAPPHVMQLPTTALMFRKEGLQVATVDDRDHIVLKSIQLAEERGAVVDVNVGLTPQDRVVDSPRDSIADGELVRIAGGQDGAAVAKVVQP
ncbi:MAG: efflux RND transporter periplasmic adaptor subunit [Steroidobacteraceae bacterium]